VVWQSEDVRDLKASTLRSWNALEASSWKLLIRRHLLKSRVEADEPKLLSFDK